MKPLFTKKELRACNKMAFTKKHMRNEKIVVNVKFHYPDYRGYVENYRYTLEEIVIHILERSQEFKFLYWENNRIPNVQILENKGWCENEIRAKVIFEKL
jgi:hypothetical protein